MTGPLVLRADQVLPGPGLPVIRDGAVRIVGGRVDAVGPAAAVTVPEGARVIDLPGAVLVPGLVNAHQHGRGISQLLMGYPDGPLEPWIAGRRRHGPPDIHAVTRLAAEAMLLAFESPEHAVHQVGRINEVSRHIEDFLLSALNAVEGIHCTIPLNASGEIQRSGYPDLRLEHTESGRVFYLDPKVYKVGSETSSFRTFYFEPKKVTNKILDDASHLLLGISHAGKSGGRWQFEAWKLVDLVDFRVRLKAEFQASNRELYLEEAVLRQSKPAEPGP